MPLFDGVENFNPAFQGRQLAIQSGQGAGASISRGMATAQRGKAQDLDERQVKFNEDKFNDTVKRLDMFKAWLDNAIKDKSKLYPAVPWNQMPIPSMMPFRNETTPAFGGVIGSGGPLGMGIDTASLIDE